MAAGGSEGERREHAREPPFRPVAPPAVNLPKGGGALRSIGEKFTAGGPTGTGSMQVPLAISPGRAGVTPDLALRYDSGGGQSVFGIGWKLTVPNITRRTDRGLPRYADADESDVFILTGAEDLVPLLAGAGWARDAFDEGDFHVERYRPRVEGMFARIERRTHRADGIAHWRTITNDNVTSLFGLSDGARIADPHDPRRVYSWLLEATFDDRGQLTVYEYKAEDLARTRADDVVEETRRATPPVNRHLKRVRYGKRAPLAGRAPTTAELTGSDFLFEVVFDYGEHTDDTPEERIPWALRPDPFSTYRATFELRTYRLCQRVLMFQRMPEQLDGEAASLVRVAELTYEPAAVTTYLRAVRHVGYRLQDGVRTRAVMPALTLDYSRAELDTTVHELSPQSLADLHGGIDGRRHQLLDLEGEGLVGVLVVPDRPTQALYYKRNLGDGELAPADRLPLLPADVSEGARLTSLDADGRLDVVELDGPVAGYYERTRDGGWRSFTPFRSRPNINTHDPNTRFIDLDGDGLPDLLVARDDVFVWYPSLGREGFGAPLRVAKPGDERFGPSVMFADERLGIFLADMSGDGLQDIVRIQNGEVSYWPNLGYGHFGAKIVMRAAPIFDAADRFDARRVRLGDVDGSGTTDLVYLSGDGARIYFNQSGNGFGEAHHVPIPPAHGLTDVQLADLLGTGTSCLVWSSRAPADDGTQVRYVDLLKSVKPHLLVTAQNGLGGETVVSYAPSTRFYLEDRRAGRPWVTRLPFPVQVIAKVEVLDHIEKTRSTSEYRYAHGFYDGVEREFRGFARVEQWDSERFPAEHGAGDAPAYPVVGDEFVVPPVHTVTWYHTGAWSSEGHDLEARVQSEFFHDPLEPPFPPTRMPEGLAAAELREAWRALKGHPLRQEVYAEDGAVTAALPYTVTDHSYEVRRVQPIAGQRHGAFHPFERETVSAHYERSAADPRIEHELQLEVDPLGHVKRNAHLAYPRRAAGEPEQAMLLATCARFSVAPPIDDADNFRHGIVTERWNFELPLAGAARFSLKDADDAMLNAGEVAFDAPAPLGKKRVLEHVRHRFFKDDLTGPLAFGAVEPRALVYDHYALTLPVGLRNGVFGGDIVDAELLDPAGYLLIDGDWWAHAGVTTYDAAQFYQPIRFTDVFGNSSTVVYDDYRLFIVEEHSSDLVAFDNITRAEIDYQALAPFRTTDPNGNRNAVKFDALRMVTATAAMGRAGAGEGDTLADPTTRIEYGLLRWETDAKPTFVHAFTRELHGAANARWLESYSYSDGAGHEVLKKAQAERGPDGAARWVGSGRTVFDNKGNAIKKYEPYFSDNIEYEDEPALVMSGYSSVFHYDPLSRLVRTDFPDGTFATVEFDAWSETRFDASDNVIESQWYAERIALPAGDPDRRAADLAAAHAHTPAVHHLDAMGRTFLSVADNGAEGTYRTRLVLEITGEHREVWDGRNLQVLKQTFDAQGHVLRAESVDVGTTRNLYDGTGRPYRSWDARNFAHRKKYDRLHRLTHVYVSPPGGAEFLGERIVYGEGLPQPNFRGRLYQHFDGAGLASNDEYDFEGRITRSSRRLALAYQDVPRWTPLEADAAPASYLGTALPLLEGVTFATATDFDAMGRVRSVTTPDHTAAHFTYNEAALLERVDANLRGAGAATPFVTGIDYNARGQRTAIAYAHLRTDYAYEARSTMLAGITTTRIADGVQMQDLRYTFDPAHNIVQIVDGVLPRVFFAGDVVDGTQLFEYDALYRLKRAEGREHPGQVGYALGPDGYPEPPLAQLPHRNDLNALLRYIERYAYDAAGNIQSMAHAVPAAPANGFTRHYEYEAGSNRLARTSRPGDPDGGPYTAIYHYDDRGNTIEMPHLAQLHWDHDDRMGSIDLRGGGHVYYTYDSKGQRARKVIERGGRVYERVYIGNYERYRERNGASLHDSVLALERETVHVYDGHKRLALVETDTTDPAAPRNPRIRLQFANHLGTASLETDPDGVPISYEEYFPFGGSAFRAGDPDKRYRYGGKEHDQETGFYYHGARYYAPWLGRWTSPDPAGLVDGTDVYSYVENNPIKFGDPTGLWEWPSWRTVAVVAAVVVIGTVVTVATAGAAGPLVGAAVASIGLTGTAATVATGVVVGAVAGAAGGIAGEVARTGVGEGRLPTGRELAHAAATGAAFGAVTGGLGAFASTARGAQAASTAARAASRIPGAATAARAARAVATGARAVARVPGVSQTVRATAAVARATGRGLGAIERAAGSAGIRAARGVFTGARGTQFLDAYAATRSIAAAHGAARPTTPASGGAAAAGSTEPPAQAGQGTAQGAAPGGGGSAPGGGGGGSGGASGGGGGGTAAGAPAAPPPPPPVAPAAPASSAATLTTGQIGRAGEQQAANFLQSQGFSNVRSIQNASGHGIDLIAERGGQTFFFEVKATTGATAPALSTAQGNVTNFVTTRLARAAAATGQWRGVAGSAVQTDAANLLSQIQSGQLQIQGQVLRVTGVGTATPVVSPGTW